MPGPALNPIANTAPVASVKSATGTRPDASADTGKTEAPEQGFASELKRQMRGESSPDEAASSDAKAAAVSDEAAKPTEDAAQAQAPTAPADLSALLAGAAAAANAIPTPLPRTTTGVTPDSAKGAIDTTAGLSVDGGEAGKPSQGLTDLAADAANLAGHHAAPAGPDATPAPKTPPADLAGTDAITSSRHGPETGADVAAAPTNNFAAIHAAALANLRGESAQPVASPVPLHVTTPAGAPGWPEEVGNRVSWMVGQSESHAELTLTPPQLGKVEVSITISGDQTTAQIVAATPAARDLIEQSLPRLREVLEQSGINLGQTDVGTSGQPGGSGEGRRGGQFNPSRGTNEIGVSTAAASPWLRRAEGLVDTFA